MLTKSKEKISSGSETSMYSRTRRRSSPALFIGVVVTVVVGLLGVALLVVAPLLISHAAPSRQKNNTPATMVSGTLTATLTAGTVQIQSDLTFTNASNLAFTLKIADLAKNKQLFQETTTTTANGLSTATTTFPSQVQKIPNSWVATISTGNHGKVIGVALFLSKDTTAKATFTAMAMTDTAIMMLGTLTAKLTPATAQAPGTVRVKPMLMFTNFANKHFTLTITDRASTQTLFTSQAQTTNATGHTTGSVSFPAPLGLTTIPTTWEAKIVANGTTPGIAPFVPNTTTMTTAIATFKATTATATAISGTLTATLTPGTAQAPGLVRVQGALAFTNFASKQFTLTVTNSAGITVFVSQPQTTDATGHTATMNLPFSTPSAATTIPTGWVATITNIAQGTTLGTAPFSLDNTAMTATITFTA